MATRGIRNNNPLNIRKGSRWVGLCPIQTDKSFCQFTAPVYGFRAGFVILRNYYKKLTPFSLRTIITRWAPPSENNTQRYIDYVSQVVGIHPDSELELTDKMSLCAIVAAMAFYECGKPGTLQEVITAYNMVFKTQNP